MTGGDEGATRGRRGGRDGEDLVQRRVLSAALIPMAVCVGDAGARHAPTHLRRTPCVLSPAQTRDSALRLPSTLRLKLGTARHAPSDRACYHRLAYGVGDSAAVNVLRTCYTSCYLSITAGISPAEIPDSSACSQLVRGAAGGREVVGGVLAQAAPRAGARWGSRWGGLAEARRRQADTSKARSGVAPRPRVRSRARALYGAGPEPCVATVNVGPSPVPQVSPRPVGSV